MFFMKGLPTDIPMQEFALRYSNMNPSAIKTCAELMRTGSGLLAAFETVLGKYGLSQGRFLVLIVMNRTPHEKVNPSVLAETLGVQRATVTGLLNRLDKDNFIERLAETRDRRRIGVRLRPEGRQVLEKILPEYYRIMARLTASLSEKERETLKSLLEKINLKLSSIYN